MKPKFYGIFRELPLCSIQPHGWLREYFITQAQGLTGRLEDAGYPFNTHGWARPEIGADNPTTVVGI
jgi:uncharacterized protein